jgi:uncharacterized protein DUF5615
MLALLIDQNFDHDILQGLYRRRPELYAITVSEMELSASPDPTLLAWAADNDRVLVTHDVHKMPGYIAARIAGGESIMGVLIVPQLMPIGRAIDDLELIVVCTEINEWKNLVRHLPL